jgi:hypothetical protein
MESSPDPSAYVGAIAASWTCASREFVGYAHRTFSLVHLPQLGKLLSHFFFRPLHRTQTFEGSSW